MDDYKMTPEEQALVDENTKIMAKVHEALPESLTGEQVELILANIAGAFADKPATAVAMLAGAAGQVLGQPKDFWQKG